MKATLPRRAHGERTLTIKDILNCTHEKTNFRKRMRSNGMLYISPQCADCGCHGRGEPRAYPFSVLGGRTIESLKEFDEQALDEYKKAEDIARRVKVVRENDDKRSQRAAYYQSAEWKHIRAKVIKRAGGICEGCLEASATQVHHLTYQHFGAELMYELVAICDLCHETEHYEHKALDDDLRQIAQEEGL